MGEVGVAGDMRDVKDVRDVARCGAGLIPPLGERSPGAQVTDNGYSARAWFGFGQNGPDVGDVGGTWRT